MNQTFMLIGIALAAVGLLFCAFTTRWRHGWIFRYRIKNWRLFLLGLVLLVVGLSMVLATAYANGQLSGQR